jgi:hypothetical protein
MDKKGPRGVNSVFLQRRKYWGHGAALVTIGASNFAYFDTSHHNWYPTTPASYRHGGNRGYWLSSISDRDSCLGHVFIINPLLTFKTAERFWGDWVKLPQETHWFQTPGWSRCPDLFFFFILVSTFVDLLPSFNTCKGRAYSLTHEASPDPRNWRLGDVRKQDTF